MSDVATAPTPEAEVKLQDYSLVGPNAKLAVEKGLAEADWYTCHVPREEMRKLLERKDGPAIRDTLIWFAVLIGAGTAGVLLWPSPWAIIPFLIYGIIYASSSDSRWHESSHGTAFKTDWMNNVLYEISSFMVMRESTVWRWSHARHHSDTIIVGRDPEIAVPRPPDIPSTIMAFFNLKVIPAYFKKIIMHSFGKMDPEEETFIPNEEYPKIYFRARIYVLIYASVIAACFIMGSILPLMLIGLPSLYGAFMMPVYGLTQHAGLAENVLDHRLNCRTVHMNWINRYLYWNMNYHVEHHMFPLVPYHQLKRLHKLVKDDMPTPYNSIVEAYREIIPAVLRQVKDPGYYVKRKLPEAKERQCDSKHFDSAGKQIVDGWVEVCDADILHQEEAIRFDHVNRTFALYRTADGALYASDGICTHGNTHLGTGMVIGKTIECPKHNGRFNLEDGSPARAPICVGLKTYDVKEEGGKLKLDLGSAHGSGTEIPDITYKFRVVSNENVATFIKELVLEPETDNDMPGYRPGDYIQLDIPAYEKISFRDFAISERFKPVWESSHVFDYASTNEAPTRRNYSLATNPGVDKLLRFNVRIATPPRGQDCPAGAGSTYVFNLKPGDKVTAIGPFGDFRIKDTGAEMVYLGGGAGMAPLRSHLSHLFETLKTGRKVSYWYGARSKQEMFYTAYFEKLAAAFDNFSFHVALSEPLPEDNWDGPTGFIHEVLKREYLDGHETPQAIEYYLCGPPMMIEAARNMLTQDIGIQEGDIAFDEF